MGLAGAGKEFRDQIIEYCHTYRVASQEAGSS
jgi:hypothetical protein